MRIASSTPAHHALHEGLVARLLLLAALVLLPRFELAAQLTTSATPDTGASPRWQLSLGGGFARVSDTPLSRTNQGYTLQAGLGMRTSLPALRLSFDALFTDAGATRVSALTGNARLAAPVSWSARPYLVAGGGAYKDHDTQTTAGFNLGVGITVRAGRQVLFMESRFHSYRNVYGGDPYVVPNGVVTKRQANQLYLWHPLTFGFRF